MEDLHNKWPHRWISDKAESFKSSIHGWGVIAKKPIKKGELVMAIGCIIIPKKDIYKFINIEPLWAILEYKFMMIFG